MTTEHHVLWSCARLSSSEHGVLRVDNDTQQLRGVAVVPRDDQPCHIEYSILLDHWHTRRVAARIDTAGTRRDIAVIVDAHGGWSLGTKPAPHLDGCTDIDLGWSPITNTIPIRRLGVEVGASATIQAAWIRFPNLEVVASEQEYTRLAADRWRYRSGEHDYELRTDADTGLVLQYGDDLWRATATADS
jgi:uncharacterized protein